MSNFIAVCKFDCVNIVNTDEEVTPGNIGALKFGLMALLKEDAQDFVRAQELWDMANKLLANESEDDEGAGAQRAINVVDQFQVSRMNSNWPWPNDYGYNYP